VVEISTRKYSLVGKKMQIPTSGENKVTTFLPVTFHHVAALVQPSLFYNLQRNLQTQASGGYLCRKNVTSILHESPRI